MRVDLFGLKGASWADEISAADCIGFAPEISKDRGRIVLRPVGGTNNFLRKDTSDKVIDVYSVNSANSDFPTRVYFIWYDNSAAVYKVSSAYWNGSAITENEIGTLTGASGSFSNMTHDSNRHGGKVLFGDSEANTVWYITMNNTVTSDTVTLYTMPIGWEVQTLTYQDGFFLGSIKDSGANEERRKVIQSDFGTHTFTSTNYYERKAGVGNIVKVLSDSRDVWVFCEDAIFTLYNAGAEGFSFARNNSTYIQVGVFSPYSIVLFQHTMMFLGVSKTGQLGIFQMDGYTPIDISPNGLHEQLEGGLDISYIKYAGAHSASFGNNETYVFTPFYDSILTPWAYNLKDKMWYQPHNSWPYLRGGTYTTMQTGASVESSKYQLLTHSQAVSGGVITHGRGIVYADPDAYYLYNPNLGGSVTQSQTVISKHIFGEDNKKLKHKRLLIEFIPLSENVTISYSDDYGSTYTVLANNVSISSGFLDYRAIGAAEDRIYKVTFNPGTAPITILNAWIEVEQMSV